MFALLSITRSRLGGGALIRERSFQVFAACELGIRVGSLDKSFNCSVRTAGVLLSIAIFHCVCLAVDHVAWRALDRG